jgi:hypothetical protein
VRIGVDVLDGAGRLEPPVDGDDAELVDMAGVQALHHHRVLVQLLLRHHPLRLLLLPKISFSIRKKYWKILDLTVQVFLKDKGL